MHDDVLVQWIPDGMAYMSCITVTLLGFRCTQGVVFHYTERGWDLSARRSRIRASRTQGRSFLRIFVSRDQKPARCI